MAKKKKRKKATPTRGQEFAEWLGLNGFTTESFARDIQVGYNTVSRWRQDRTTPRPSLVAVIVAKHPSCPMARV